MSDLLGALNHTPLPTILVVAGIAFWILAIAGSLAGKITSATKAPSSQGRPQPGDPHIWWASPGVECRGSADEVAICRSEELRKLDLLLYGAYHAVLKGLNKDQQVQLADDESDWVKIRGRCGANEDCIANAYRLRIQQLQTSP